MVVHLDFSMASQPVFHIPDVSNEMELSCPTEPAFRVATEEIPPVHVPNYPQLVRQNAMVSVSDDSTRLNEVKRFAKHLADQDFDIAPPYLEGTEVLSSMRSPRTDWLELSYQHACKSSVGPASYCDASGAYACWIGFIKYVDYDSNVCIGKCYLDCTSNKIIGVERKEIIFPSEY